jgi:hypothetical protein
MHERTVRTDRPEERPTMNAESKLVAAAKRAARTLSRAEGHPYQKCLDLVAIRAGLPTWSAFLANPVPVDDASREAALEPDFSAIPHDMHMETVVRYGLGIDATAFRAYARKDADAPPVLDFAMADGTSRPIDGRGLSIHYIVSGCSDPTPTIAGALLRAKSSSEFVPQPEATCSLDGSAAPELTQQINEASIPYADHHWPTPGVIGRTARRISRRLKGAKLYDQQKLLKRHSGLVDKTTAGPLVAIGEDGRRVRLHHGYTLRAFSPPGTGRLVGIVVPMVLTGDTSSFVIHEDGQVHAHTSGYRATLGRIAVIRTAGGSRDSINPYSKEWLPTKWPGSMRSQLDKLSRAIAPNDHRVARLILETSHEIVRARHETTLTEIRDAIALRMDELGVVARDAVATLLPLTTPAAVAAVGGNTVLPTEIRGTGTRDEPRPITIYLIRDPMDGSSREPLAAFIQTAIWMHTGGSRNKGPCGLATIHYDFHRSTHSPRLRSAMDYARSFGDSIVVCGNSASRMVSLYGERDGRDLLDMFHHTLIPTQSSGTEAELIDRRDEVGYQTMRSLDFGRAILTTGATHAEFGLPLFYKDEVMKTKAYAEGCTGPAPVG